MKAAVRTLLMLCSGPLLVLLGGLPFILQAGQVNPLHWSWPALMLVPVALMLTLKRGWLHAIWAGVGSVGTVLIFITLAASSSSAISEVGWLALVVALAVMAGICLSRRTWVGGILCVGALLSCWVARERPLPAPPSPRPELAVISALPLFWREGEAGFGARSDAPIITILRQRFDVRPLDSPLAGPMARAKALLVAQPRALSPAELVALDDWVRKGGRLLLLADPVLRWPSPLPLGDRRRPPSISMAAPLLHHWGVRLLAPAALGEERRVLEDGGLLTTMASSRFALAPRASCRLEEHGLIARCRIGRGEAVLIADADLIDDRLWLADVAAPLNPRLWTADTPAFVIEGLGGGAMERRNWLRTMADLVRALRWGLLTGIGWAVLGTVILGRLWRANAGGGIRLRPAVRA